MKRFTLGLFILFLSTDLFAQSSVRRRPVFPVSGGALARIGTIDAGGAIAGSGSTITRSYTTVNATNSCLVVFVPYYNTNGTTTISSATFAGNAMTQAANSTAGDYAGSVWVRALGASYVAETADVVITFSAADTSYSDAIITQWENCHQTTPTHDGIGTTATQETGTATLTVANVVSTDVVLATYIKADGATVYTHSNTAIHEAVVSGLTTRREIAFHHSGSSGGTISATFTSTPWGGAAVALRQA